MTDAQLGLVVATPVIVTFALVLARLGVVARSGALVAVTTSVAIATVLFLTQ